MNEISLTDAGLTPESIRALQRACEDFSSVTPEEITELVKNYALQKRQKAFNTKLELSAVDYEEEKTIFIRSYNSPATQEAYIRALRTLEEYAQRLNISVMELNTAQADNFIYSLSGRSPAYIRLTVAGVSSFFSFLERRHSSMQNPFRGTRARPKRAGTKQNAFPDEQELRTILQSIDDPILCTVIFLMADAGLRVGAFPNLTIKDGRYRTTSKGKEYRGRLSPDALNMIRRNSLNLYRPFGEYLETLSRTSDATDRQKTEALKNKVFYELRKLYRAGTIKASYSAHDFRHYYAVREYLKDHDIYRVSKLLNHSNIQITELYLKGLNVIE